MSVKLICNDKNITVDNFDEEVYVSKSGRKWVLTNADGNELDLKIQVKNCCVKYSPEKYDKMTVELDSQSRQFFEALQKKVREEVMIENILKNGAIGLKMSKDQKLLCLRTLMVGNYFDAIIKFNDVWTVNAKNYISLELIQFRKLDIEPKIEVVNYFVEDD